MKTKTRKFLAVLAGVIIAGGLCSCMDFNQIDDMTIDSVKVEKGYERQAELQHQWDSTLQTYIVDEMTSNMIIQRVEGTTKITEFAEIFHPQFTASSLLQKSEYSVNAELLNSAVVRTYLHRATGSDGSELDTVYVELADGQKIWYPVRITNKTVRVGKTDYGFGSMVLLKAIYRGAKNAPIEKSIAGNVYKTTYKTSLFLQEKNVSNPKTLEVQIYAFAIRTVPSDRPKNEFAVSIKNRNRTPIDETTERLSFTEVFTYASGNVSNIEVSTVLDRRFIGQNFSHQVHDFDYKRTGSNGVKDGKETFVEKRNNWSIYAKTDIYSAPFENGVVIDTLSSCYELRHQRAVYEDEYVKVEFGYEAIRIIEVKTEVTKQSNVSAVLRNQITTVYLGFGQDLENNISLYR